MCSYLFDNLPITRYPSCVASSGLYEVYEVYGLYELYELYEWYKLYAECPKRCPANITMARQKLSGRIHRKHNRLNLISCERHHLPFSIYYILQSLDYHYSNMPSDYTETDF